MTVIEKKYTHSKYLVEADWLHQHLDTVDLRVFDCTVNVMPNPDQALRTQMPFVFQSGHEQYDLAHIPRAGFIDVPGELSDPSSALPLTLPGEEQFVSVMNELGIGDDTKVVLYSATESNWATRVWWLLRVFGFDNAAILNGGWAKWSEEGRPVSNQACEYKPNKFVARHRPNLFVDREDVLAALSDDDVCIVSALPSPIHEGTSDVVFGRKGHIPGSVNLPFGALHDENTGRYLPADQLQRKFNEMNVNKAERVITYCGGGIAASNDAFALTLLGYDNVAVYDGSMLEWGNNASMPMEQG